MPGERETDGHARATVAQRASETATRKGEYTATSTSEAVPVRIPDVELYGYADRISVCPGERLTLMTSASAPRIEADVLRFLDGSPEPLSVPARLGRVAGLGRRREQRGHPTSNVLRTMLGRDLATASIGPASGSGSLTAASGVPIAPLDPPR